MEKTDYLSLAPNELSQQEVYNYLIAAIAPRPICFASTIDKLGKVNLSPFSFFNVFSTSPPIMIFSPARSGRDNTTKHTLDNVLEVPEVTINIVNYPLVEQMSLASTAYDKGVNEFVKSGLTPVESDKVKPPRVGESPVSFECKVNEVVALGDTAGAGNLVICEVIKIHIQKRYLDKEGQLDSEVLDLVARMGGAWYARCTPESLFKIPKPLQSQGIGVDRLPDHARDSKILTGNVLGRLGNAERLPSLEELKINKEKYFDPIDDEIKQLEESALLEKLHKMALQQLTDEDALVAISTLINTSQYINEGH